MIILIITIVNVELLQAKAHVCYPYEIFVDNIGVTFRTPEYSRVSTMVKAFNLSVKLDVPSYGCIFVLGLSYDDDDFAIDTTCSHHPNFTLDIKS